MPALHFTAAPDAAEALKAMRQRHKDAGAAKADIIVALGGDGFMLQTLHAFLGTGKPIYGMNLGSVGFLMNEYRADDLLQRLEAAERALCGPVRGKRHQLRYVRHAELFDVCPRFHPVDRQRPARRLEKSEQERNDRALPCSVRARNPEHLPGSDVERDVLNRAHLSTKQRTVRLGHTTQCDQGPVLGSKGKNQFNM